MAAAAAGAAGKALPLLGHVHVNVAMIRVLFQQTSIRNQFIVKSSAAAFGLLGTGWRISNL